MQDKDIFKQKIKVQKDQLEEQEAVIANFTVIQEQIVNQNKDDRDKVKITKDSLKDALQKSKENAKRQKWKKKLDGSGSKGQEVSKYLQQKLENTEFRMEVFTETMKNTKFVLDRKNCAVQVLYMDIGKNTAKIMMTAVPLMSLVTAENYRGEDFSEFNEFFEPVFDPLNISIFNNSQRNKKSEGGYQRSASFTSNNLGGINQGLAGGVFNFNENPMNRSMHSNGGLGVADKGLPEVENLDRSYISNAGDISLMVLDNLAALETSFEGKKSRSGSFIKEKGPKIDTDFHDGMGQMIDSGQTPMFSRVIDFGMAENEIRPSQRQFNENSFEKALDFGSQQDQSFPDFLDKNTQTSFENEEVVINHRDLNLNAQAKVSCMGCQIQ